MTIYRDLSTGKTPPNSYMTLPLPGLSAHSTSFCPYEDVIAVGHEKGISSLLVPGSGEPNFDSAEADIYESHSRRREREVRGVLEKIRPELITLDTNYLGKIGDNRPETYTEREGRSFRQLPRLDRLRSTGQAEEEGEHEDGLAEDIQGKKEKVAGKMKGKGGSMKRYLAKRRKNVIDPTLVGVQYDGWGYLTGRSQ